MIAGGNRALPQAGPTNDGAVSATFCQRAGLSHNLQFLILGYEVGRSLRTKVTARPNRGSLGGGHLL